MLSFYVRLLVSPDNGTRVLEWFLALLSFSSGVWSMTPWCAASSFLLLPRWIATVIGAVFVLASLYRAYALYTNNVVRSMAAAYIGTALWTSLAIVFALLLVYRGQQIALIALTGAVAGANFWIGVRLWLLYGLVRLRDLGT